MYAKTQENFEIALDIFENDPVVCQYPQYLEHIRLRYLSRIEKWAKYVRATLPTHNIDTNNICEASFHTLKDKIMARQKAYNCPDLLKHILEKDSKHFEDKLIMIANGQFLQHQLRELRDQVNLVNLRRDQVVKLADQIFVVQSESNEEVFYEVNMATGECQCSRGATRGQCKHKFAITHYYKIAAFSALPANDPGMRATWDYVWTGVVLVRPAHRYRGLDDEDHDGPGVEEFVQQQRQRGHSPAKQVINYLMTGFKIFLQIQFKS